MRRFYLFCGFAILLLGLSDARPVHAQRDDQSHQPDARLKGDTRPNDKAGKDAGTKVPDKVEEKRRLNPFWRGAIPDGGAERARLLDELYRQLAASTDEKHSEQLDKSIQRVWLSSGSDTVDALMRRALAAQKAKNTKLAISLLDKIVNLAPDYAEAFARRAFIHYGESDVERAVGDLRRAIALDPNHFKALDGLGEIFKELGRKQAALTIFRSLAKVHPHSVGVKAAIQQIELELEGQGI